MKNIKNIMLIAAFTVISLTLNAQSATWNFDASHSKVRFSIAHMVISEVEGSFNTYEGTLQASKEDFSDLKTKFTIDVNSIDTDNAQRDGHLKAEDFFNVAKYPSIVFESTSVTKGKGANLKITGNLTMRGVTKEVTLDATYGGTVKDPWGNTRAGLKITGELNRKDWGLVYNSTLETGGLMLGENVSIVCKFELIKARS